MPWADKIRSTRTLLGRGGEPMSQERFAYLLGVAVRTVWRWENAAAEPRGKTRHRVVRHIAALCAAAQARGYEDIESAAATLAEELSLPSAEILDRILRPRIAPDGVGPWNPLRQQVLSHFAVEDPNELSGVEIADFASLANVAPDTIRAILYTRGHRSHTNVSEAVSSALFRRQRETA